MTKQEAMEYLEKLFMIADITDEYGDMADTEPYETAIDMAVEALKERKTGKWIRTAGEYIGDDVSGFYNYHWSCSECEREAIINYWNMYELSDYCPHCGVKMEGEADG